MTAELMGRSVIKIINGIVNYTVLVIIVLLIGFAGYALWDSKQIYQAADKSLYTVYKPTAADEGKSFKELQAINTEVFAWLTVYGTNIDYPVTQGPDNMKYVDTDAEGRYSLSGAIFLDYENSRDFSDFNSILYGHHMAKKAMFGEIGEFANRNIFDSRKYGNLYFDDKDHDIEFFAFVHCDAYDREVFTSNVAGEEDRQAYLDGLLEKAIYTRDIGVTVKDQIILLSTCSSSSTNGRDILIGQIFDESVRRPEYEYNDVKEQISVDVPNYFVEEVPLWQLFLILIFPVLLFTFIGFRLFSLAGQKRPKMGVRINE